MPRRPTILQSDFPYNISSRCINREWFNLPMPVVWEIFREELINTHNKLNLVIHSFVLMSNHYHLLASTPESNISQCMQAFKQNTSRRLTREGNRINQTFAGRYFKCIIQHENFLRSVYKYNYRNPVTAGICTNVEEYPYSTLQDLIGNKKSNIPIEDHIFENTTTTLKWLNTPPPMDKLEAVRFGSKKMYFESKKRRSDNSPIISIDEIL